MPNVMHFVGVMKDVLTAGPGKRLEFFTKGCIRGVTNPCKGCFNESTWTFQGPYRRLTIDEVVDICVRDAWNRQITFCGGEPMLQAIAITEVAKRLKEIDPTFHIVMYTAYLLDVLLKKGLHFGWSSEKHGDAMKEHLDVYSDVNQHLTKVRTMNDGRVVHNMTLVTADQVKELLQYVDIIVDGDYQHDKRLTTAQYMHDGGFIGSANQRVIDGPLSYLVGQLMYEQADEYMNHFEHNYHCQTCGKELVVNMPFCTELCQQRFQAYQKNRLKIRRDSCVGV